MWLGEGEPVGHPKELVKGGAGKIGGAVCVSSLTPGSCALFGTYIALLVSKGFATLNHSKLNFLAEDLQPAKISQIIKRWAIRGWVKTERHQNPENSLGV